MGGGTEKRAGKTGSDSSGRGRGDDSESLLNGTWGEGGVSGFTPWRMFQCLAPAPSLPVVEWGRRGLNTSEDHLERDKFKTKQRSILNLRSIHPHGVAQIGSKW